MSLELRLEVLELYTIQLQSTVVYNLNTIYYDISLDIVAAAGLIIISR